MVIFPTLKIDQEKSEDEVDDIEEIYSFNNDGMPLPDLLGPFEYEVEQTAENLNHSDEVESKEPQVSFEVVERRVEDSEHSDDNSDDDLPKPQAAKQRKSTKKNPKLPKKEKIGPKYNWEKKNVPEPNTTYEEYFLLHQMSFHVHTNISKISLMLCTDSTADLYVCIAKRWEGNRCTKR